MDFAFGKAGPKGGSDDIWNIIGKNHAQSMSLYNNYAASGAEFHNGQIQPRIQETHLEFVLPPYEQGSRILLLPRRQGGLLTNPFIHELQKTSFEDLAAAVLSCPVMISASATVIPEKQSRGADRESS